MTSKLSEKEADGNGEHLLSSNDDQTLLDEAGRSGCSEENAQFSGQSSRNSQIIRDIARLMEEYMGYDQESPEENEFPIVIGNVCDMIDKFRACARAADSFVAAFPSWIEIRKSNIEKLTELANYLDSLHFNCNVSRLTSSSVGIVGGIVSIVGAVLIPFTLGASSALLIGGSAVAAAGGVTNVGTAIAESVLMKNGFEDAKDLMKKDKKAFRRLERWFLHCPQFLESVNKIVDFDIFMHLLEGVQKLKECVSVNDKNDALNYEVVVKFAVDFCMQQSVPVAQITGVVFAVVVLYRLPQLLRLMRDFHRSTPVLYEAIVFTMNIALQIAKATDVGADTVTTVLSVVRGGSAVSRPVAAAVANSVFGGVGVAIDVASVVLTTIDVHNGSKSEHAEKIREVIKVLESEMTTLNQLNKELQKVTGKNE